MSMEGMPETPVEKKEKEPITDEKCIEAMKAENFELVREWYAEQEKISVSDPTGKGHIELTMHMATIQFRARLFEDAKETLEAAHMDAMGQKNFEMARLIEDRLDSLEISIHLP